MRLSAVLLTLALLSACGLPAAGPASVASPDGGRWRWAGPPVALAGRATSVVFERDGTTVGSATPKTIRIDARCIDCAAAALRFDATSPGPQYQMNPGTAEAIVATVIFPAEGTWTFEPVGGQLLVRSPTSGQAPLVVVRPASGVLPANCGSKEIATAIARLAQGFNTASLADLARVLDRQIDFSMTGEPLPRFVTNQRDEVADYARVRTQIGEKIYPYLVYAAATADDAIDLGVYFVRQAPDLPSTDGYRRAFAGSRLRCQDLLLLRFNADVVGN